jgi:hypothetical protein
MGVLLLRAFSPAGTCLQSRCLPTGLTSQYYRPAKRWYSPSSYLVLKPWSRVQLEKLIVAHLVRKLPAIDGTWRFLSVFTRAHQRSLSWARWIHFIPSDPISVTLSSHLGGGFPGGTFPPGCLTTEFLFPPIRAKCLDHLILIDWITMIIFDVEYTLWSSSPCSFLQSPVRVRILPQEYKCHTPESHKQRHVWME